MIFHNEINQYFNKVKKALDLVSISELDAFINLLEASRQEGKLIFIMGNGGSAATASHFVCDFNKGISINQEKPYKFICLNENVPSMMAYSNDGSYDDIFQYQLKTFMTKGDVVIGISGSGNSKNIVNALRFANDKGGITVAITGFDGGIAKQISKYSVNVPVADMQITEDIHMIFDHCMMKILSSRVE